MLRFTLLLTAVIPLIAVSCASNIVLNSQYTAPRYDDSSLAVVIDGEPAVHYEGNVEPEFGPGDPETLITEFFKKQLVADIQKSTTLKNVSIETCTGEGPLDRHILEKSGIEVSVLANGGMFKCRGGNPTYVLVLTNMSIGTVFNINNGAPAMGANGMMTGGGTWTTKELVYEAKALLYDNRSRQFIEYGLFTGRAMGAFSVITMNEWNGVSRSFVARLFAKTKFYRYDAAE
jgi:hypothetical protein